MEHGSMSLKVAVCLSVILSQFFVVTSETDARDVIALTTLRSQWQNVPPNWKGFVDPCGNHWVGIVCSGSRVISISLSSMGLQGTFSGDIQELSELQTLDLSYNKGLSGPIPSAIGKLSKLSSLILVGCNFNGELPDSIGSLSQLIFLSLNSNSFIGRIPNSIGDLSRLYWLDLADNKLTGTIPVSNGSVPGLDMLVNAKHFHCGKNQLSGSIPDQLFNEKMTLIHVLFDNNQLTGGIPSTIGLVQTLEVLRLDWNSLSGPVPTNISDLTNVTDLYLSNNRLTGPMPDLTAMIRLTYLDMSNNTFEPSDVPSWFSALPSLTTLYSSLSPLFGLHYPGQIVFCPKMHPNVAIYMLHVIDSWLFFPRYMEGTQIQGTVPATLFSLPQLQTVVLKKNRLNGILELGDSRSPNLTLVDLQINNISAYTQRPGGNNLQLILAGNPVCADSLRAESYCNPPQQAIISYSTAHNCIPVVCNSNEVSSPNCQCAYPYIGTLSFRSVQFSDMHNPAYYGTLEQKLVNISRSKIDSVSLSNISRDSSNYLKMTVEIFPFGQDRSNRTAISAIGFILSNQTFKPPPTYGPYYFIANNYIMFADEPEPQPKDMLGIGAIIGIAVGGCAILLILLYVGVCTFCRKRPAKTAAPLDSSGIGSSASWMSLGSNNLKLAGSRIFSFEDIKKITHNFSEANEIGSGAYGKVFRGDITNGQLVAVKRSQRGSSQGGDEFKTEIELLSRVHHKNLVRLLGFCSEKNELILVYEYIPNGTLNESLSGKSGIRLDWKRRIRVALGAARGLAYLHELANPPIVHRDIKSNNILLDENLNAKVSDFGLSRPLFDIGKGHIVTEVKGTLGYLDPEYYMTQKLNEKSDVYSYGVLLLELITGRPPVDQGKYIVKEVRNVMDRTQDLYGLHELLDPGIGLGAMLKGFEKYIDLALRCVEDAGFDRPAMGEVVKQLEDILEMAGVNPYSDSATSSGTFDHRNLQHLYGDESLHAHTGGLLR